MSAECKSVCKSCRTYSQKTFNGEVAIHFPALEELNNPVVKVSPKITVCLICGFTEFIVPGRELRVLVERTVTDGTLVSGAEPAGDSPDAA